MSIRFQSSADESSAAGLLSLVVSEARSTVGSSGCNVFNLNIFLMNPFPTTCEEVVRIGHFALFIANRCHKSVTSRRLRC